MGLEGGHPQPLKFIVGTHTCMLIRRDCCGATVILRLPCVTAIARKLAAIGVLVRDVEAIDRGPATSPRSGDLLVTLVASVVVLLSLWTLSVGGYPYCSPPGAVIPGCTSSG